MPYEAGEAFEPAAGRGAGHPARKGLGLEPVWLDCPDALVLDRETGRWALVGEPGPTAACVGELRGEVSGDYSLSRPAPASGREAYERAVTRVLEYIRAGDVYQVNVAHALEAAFRGDARALAADLIGRAQPRCGAYLEWDEGATRRALVSLSPEVFLRVQGGEITTVPMKGTRPQGDVHEAELRGSGKDRAELAMIVDLMRNDLGRVCELGSVRVGEPRRIEQHGPPERGVHQAVAEVAGTARTGLTWGELLREVFPAGSVTGAPKIRAMQIIRELEARERGFYCGAIGFLSRGCGELSVAIRTAQIEGVPLEGGLGRMRGTLAYGVGAGIVAESEPGAEWAETLVKARVLGEGTG